MNRMNDQRRFEIEEERDRYQSHANQCTKNAAEAMSKTGSFELASWNLQRAKEWQARADEQAAKLQAYDDERSKT
jgi:surface antigen